MSTTTLTKCDNCERSLGLLPAIRLSYPGSVLYTNQDNGKDFCQFKCLKEWVLTASNEKPKLEFQKDSPAGCII